MTLRRFAPLVLALVLLAVPASAQAGVRVASATGVTQVKGQTLYVHVVVAVPPGQSDRQATDQALAEQGASRADKGSRKAKPPWAGGPGGPGGGGGGGSEFAYTGLEWTSFPVLQSYNDDNERVAARDDLIDTQGTWSGVGGSDYRTSGGSQDTSRCPSLVQQCKGPAFNDDKNDVGWLRLGGNTLGVTWFTISDPEADMALNTAFSWSDTCTDQGNTVDVETILLHENGHVAGLDHISNQQSVMQPSYQGAQCTLFDYDEDALANLY